MPQVFQRRTNTLFRVSIAAGLLLVGGVIFLFALKDRSPYQTDVQIPKHQNVPFSHVHHVAGLGIDCRYCHNSVEKTAKAGIPAVQVCMNCHSQIWADSPMLAPVRDSYKTGVPLEWNRVHDLPDFVYFNHSIHVNKGVGCTTCHGQVDKMPLMWKANTLQMSWCLGCHREPEKYLRPRSEVFSVSWEPPKNQLELGHKLVKEYHVQKLTNCYTCHR
jgi:hypothetical protein